MGLLPPELVRGAYTIVDHRGRDYTPSERHMALAFAGEGNRLDAPAAASATDASDRTPPPPPQDPEPEPEPAPELGASSGSDALSWDSLLASLNDKERTALQIIGLTHEDELHTLPADVLDWVVDSLRPAQTQDLRLLWGQAQGARDDRRFGMSAGLGSDLPPSPPTLQAQSSTASIELEGGADDGDCAY